MKYMYKVIRGGSWNNNACYVRSAFRLNYNPSLAYVTFGFRLAQVQNMEEAK